MGSTIYDYLYEQHLEDLHWSEKIEEGIENFKKGNLKGFYLKNNDVYANILKIKKVSEYLENRGFPSPAFIHYNICIELILKDMFIFPLTYGVLLDEEFAEIIIQEIFKTPVSRFDKLVIYVVQEFGKLDLTKKGSFLKRAPWEEIKKLRAVRNKVVHSGVDCNDEDLRRIKNLVNFLIKKIVPAVLAGVGVKVENNLIVEK